MDKIENAMIYFFLLSGSIRDVHAYFDIDPNFLILPSLFKNNLNLTF